MLRIISFPNYRRCHLRAQRNGNRLMRMFRVTSWKVCSVVLLPFYAVLNCLRTFKLCLIFLEQVFLLAVCILFVGPPSKRDKNARPFGAEYKAKVCVLWLMERTMNIPPRTSFQNLPFRLWTRTNPPSFRRQLCCPSERQYFSPTPCLSLTNI